MLSTISELREEAGLTRAELAQASGVPSSTISCYELGYRAPADGCSAVVALASTLGENPANILFRIPGTHSQWKTIAGKSEFTQVF